MKRHQISLFIFRRDLRLYDNTALIAACKESEHVIPCFIFDPRQVGDSNRYRSINAIQFMIGSLQDLEKQLAEKDGKLYLFYGKTDEVIDELIKQTSAEAIYINKDYTPFSIKRDHQIELVARKNDIPLYSFHDLMLQEPDSVMNKSGQPYAVFTPFWRASSTFEVAEPESLRAPGWYTKKITHAQSPKIYTEILPEQNPNILLNGGRSEALGILKKLPKLKDYQRTRDFPALETSHLSAHNKFGTVSIREEYYAMVDALGKNHGLVRQLYWRDFFTYLAYHFPRVYGAAFHEKYNSVTWKNSKADFARWTEGNTGFPIVDAGMRQLNATGYMHNRVRMIVASFLTKDLHIDWRWGEQYFARKLIDYDPAVNNGSWQWAASTGADAQPYFRIFNPWLQQKKFDPECIYIRRWVPELAKVPNKMIHNWHDETIKPVNGYPKPMVEHEVESKKAKAAYASASKEAIE